MRKNYKKFTIDEWERALVVLKRVTTIAESRRMIVQYYWSTKETPHVIVEDNINVMN